MPCCTYIHPTDANKPLHNEELTELLGKLRRFTCREWIIQEMSFEKKLWFRKPQTIYRYQLLYPIFGIEYQVINFYRDDEQADVRCGMTVPAELIAAYIYGVLAQKE